MATPTAQLGGDTPVPTTEVDGAEVDGIAAPAEVNPEIETDAAPPPPQPPQSTVTDEQYRAMHEILDYVYNYRTPEGHDPSKLFHKRVNKRYVPDYYDVIKEPQAMSSIKASIQHKTYKSFQEYVRDWALICHNAQVYNRPDAGAYHDALTIKALVENELKKLVDADLITAEVSTLPYLGEIPHADEIPAQDEEGAAEDDEDEDESDESEEEGGKKKRGRGRPRKGEVDDKDEAVRLAETEARKRRGRPPKVDTPMEARIKNILKGLRKPKNASGDYKILSFDRLPDKTAMPGYYQEILNPMAVDTLKKKLKRKKYTSMDQFLQDVELIFENAKRFNEDDSQIYKDAVDLQTEARRLAAVEQQKPDSEFAMEDGRLPLPEGIFHNGELYKVGDWIHIQNANDLTKPIVTQIYRTWQNASGQKFVNVCWYYRPEQTVHRYDKHFFENEVVKTGQYRDHSIDEVIDRCFVMYITRYNKGKPRGFPRDKEIYICESRYNEEKHAFAKIKTWASCLPDEVRDKDYEMELYQEPKRMKKRPSPIAYLLKDEQKETDDLPKPVWGADNAPPKIGAVHRRPRDARDSLPPEPTPQPQAEPTPPRPLPPRQLSNAPTQHLRNFPSQASTFNAQTPPPRQTPTASTPALTSYTSSLAPATQPLASISPAPQQRPLAPNRNSSFKTSTPQVSRLTPANDVNTANNTASSYNSRSFNGPSQSTSNTTPHIPTYGPSSFGSAANYKAPQPIEVWSLNDAANGSIPPDIREQFLRDDAGRVLFFTAPPVEVAGESAGVVGEGGAEVLGHSAEYLAEKIRRKAEFVERRKRKAEDEARREDERERRKETLRREVEVRKKELVESAMNVWLGELSEGLKVLEAT